MVGVLELVLALAREWVLVAVLVPLVEQVEL